MRRTTVGAADTLGEDALAGLLELNMSSAEGGDMFSGTDAEDGES